MPLDAGRAERIKQAGLDAAVAVLPHHIRMLTGYRPRLGSGVALATADGAVGLAIPADEVEPAQRAGVEAPGSYQTLTLTSLTSVEHAMTAALTQLRERLQPGHVIGYARDPQMTPNAYVSTLHVGAGLLRMLEQGLAGCELRPADTLYRSLLGYKTAAEIDLLRRACRLGEAGFAAAKRTMAPDVSEWDVAGAVREALAASGVADDEDHGGGAWVMSGPNSALAYRAFAKTSARKMERGDLVLVHMNPQVGGIWADLTRTFVLGGPDTRTRPMLEAVLAARLRSLGAIQAGAGGNEIDAAARRLLSDRGYGDDFKHGLGHGIGFGGISAERLPMLHPLSSDRLAPGMCFNAEPAVYIDGVGGCRHCDALALGADGLEELSPFLSSLDDLIVAG